MSTQENNPRRYEILDGPNRNDFVMSFGYSQDGNNVGLLIAKYVVEDESDKRTRCVSIRLLEIGHKGKTGHEFNFIGECIYNSNNDVFAKVEGSYDAKKRRGTMETTSNIHITITA